MNASRTNVTAPLLALCALAVALPMSALAQAPGIEPAATKLLKRMTDYMSGLNQFSVHTQNTLEDLLESGQRVDPTVSATITISRPNKLRAVRKGDLIDQDFYYDGKSLTLYSPSQSVYATEPAPKTVEGVLDYARDTLGLIIPASDLIYPNGYDLLMRGVTSAKVLGKETVGKMKCDHLAFRRPGVDFQVWVSEGAQPLPCKYVVTDPSTPALLSVVTVMSDWKVGVLPPDALFGFVPPKAAKPVTFMHLPASATPSR